MPFETNQTPEELIEAIPVGQVLQELIPLQPEAHVCGRFFNSVRLLVSRINEMSKVVVGPKDVRTLVRTCLEHDAIDATGIKADEEFLMDHSEADYWIDAFSMRLSGKTWPRYLESKVVEAALNSLGVTNDHSLYVTAGWVCTEVKQIKRGVLRILEENPRISCKVRDEIRVQMVELDNTGADIHGEIFALAAFLCNPKQFQQIIKRTFFEEDVFVRAGMSDGMVVDVANQVIKNTKFLPDLERRFGKLLILHQGAMELDGDEPLEDIRQVLRGLFFRFYQNNLPHLAAGF